jgi:cytoskeletal protein CcmA (bactofilin family)
VTLGPRDRVIGELYIEGDLRLGGVVEGQVEATGDVEIADAATVKASVAGREVSIHGHVNGSVTARRKLLVGRSGSLVGDVRVARLVVQDGASFSGNVSMGAAALEAPPAPPPAVVEAPSEPVVETPAAAPAIAAHDGKPKPTTQSKDKGKPKRR